MVKLLPLLKSTDIDEIVTIIIMSFLTQLRDACDCIEIRGGVATLLFL